jgi:hypothetical protein
LLAAYRRGRVREPSQGSRVIVGVAIVLAAALAACDAPRPANPQLWTLFDVEALYAGGADSSHRIATDAGLPGGIPLADFYAKDATTLKVRLAWAEGYQAGYVTTELWSHFGDVWVQPAYVPVISWDNGEPQPLITPWQPIFSVGPQSRFYSPFWQIVYFDVPAGTPADAITSVRDVLDGGYPLHPAEGHIYVMGAGDKTIVPFKVGVAEQPVGGGTSTPGWLDGAAITVLDFPAVPFAFDADNVLVEVPIYRFLFRTTSGELFAPDMPTVLGTGPAHSHTPPPLDPTTKLPTAKYSGYWRVYTVVAPPGSHVFAPHGTSLYTQLENAGVPVDDVAYDPSVVDPPDEATDQYYVGRVALNPSCFTGDYDPQDTECTYLDSQDEIERFVPADLIHPTDITVTCPVVSAVGKAATP